MSKKTLHAATDPDGGVHKRTSQSRVYTHTVVACPSYRNALSWAQQILDVDRKNFYFSHAMATKGEYLSAGNRPVVLLTVRDEADRQRHENSLEGCPDADTYAVLKRDQRIAKVTMLKAEGYYDRFVSLGWTGRRDLADKLAAKARASGYWENITILKAVRT